MAVAAIGGQLLHLRLSQATAAAVVGVDGIPFPGGFFLNFLSFAGIFVHESAILEPAFVDLGMPAVFHRSADFQHDGIVFHRRRQVDQPLEIRHLVGRRQHQFQPANRTLRHIVKPADRKTAVVIEQLQQRFRRIQHRRPAGRLYGNPLPDNQNRILLRRLGITAELPGNRLRRNFFKANFPQTGLSPVRGRTGRRQQLSGGRIPDTQPGLRSPRQADLRFIFTETDRQKHRHHLLPFLIERLAATV